MKNIPFFLKLLLLVSLNSQAQDSIPSPEFHNSFYFVGYHKLTPLEKQSVSSEAKPGASTYIVGIGKTKGSNVVQLASSPVKVKASAYRFIIQVENNNIDPASIINLFQLKSDRKRNRRILEVGTAGISGNTAMKIDFLPFTAKKAPNNCYLIHVDVLQPGEYAFTLASSRHIFQMFSVEK